MTQSRLNRRTFLRQSAVIGMAFGLQGLAARGQLALPRHGRGHAALGAGGYGPLSPTASKNTGETLLALPAGFQYTVIGQAGKPMTDGAPTPGFHDGMAAFAQNGRILLVRNHEVQSISNSIGAVRPDPVRAYDQIAGAGTTTIAVDPVTRELLEDFVSLSGTLVNCAGGPTPWGSWISCEETVFGVNSGFGRDHGYCFEVPATTGAALLPRSSGRVTPADPADQYKLFLPIVCATNTSRAAPIPLKAMGRFVHEAVAVDPNTGIVYETEDRIVAGFYRYLPDTPGNLAAGGRLQMLAIHGKPNYNTTAKQQVGVALPTTWVDIDDPDPADTESNEQAVYKQGYARGGATFARLEGCWYGNNSIYINSTNGGDRGCGQVWQYRPNANQLTLIFESPSSGVLNSPDNLCVSPRGGLVLCEDNSAPLVRGLTAQGQIFDLARNMAFDSNDRLGEFAGATFSPDGRTLFVNIQQPGLTFAIWGPWELGAV